VPHPGGYLIQEQAYQGRGVVQKHRIAKRLVRRQHRFQQMHVRVLPPGRAGQRRLGLAVAARLMRHGPVHPGHQLQRRPAQRRGCRYRGGAR
jgi:hypothetical protein